MSGHEKRKLQKMGHIVKSTIELCNRYGTQKVTIDEIAEHANVSKVTIYKYFNSKEDLITTVISKIYSDIIKSTAELIDSECDFMEKLNIIMQSKIKSLELFNGDFLKDLFLHPRTESFHTFNTSIKSLMFKFFDEGKKQSYIPTTIDNETLYIYSEIFNAGLQNLITKDASLISNKNLMNSLVHLYFNGLIQ